MSGFCADAVGMNALYNLLLRAFGDAKDTLEYTVRHCDMEFTEEGLLMILAGPHRKAYDGITQALDRVQTLTRAAGTQINLAQRDYATADAAAAARLDESYSGARDPAAVRQLLSSGRPDGWPTAARSPFEDVAEPAQKLLPPNYATGIEVFRINALSDLISPAAWLRQATVWLFGRDPFEGWGEALSGDWESYVHCAVAWGIIGNAIHGIGRNLTAGAADASSVWRGNAAEAEQEFQLALGAAALALQPVCDQYGQLYNQAAEAAKHLFSVVTALISKLIDVLIVINLASAVGTATIETGVGAVAGYGVAAYYAWQAYDLYNEISNFYSNAEAIFRGIAGSIIAIEAGMEVAALPDLVAYRHPAGHPG
jgi:uncharacterized protein YukE